MSTQITNFKLNWDGMIAVSNAANKSVCHPIARRIAAQVGGHVETDPRGSKGDWAHSYAVAHIKHVKSGKLLRAFQGGS